MAERPQTRDDKDLLELLTKVYSIQEDVGARPKTSAEDKRNRAEHSAMQGKGRAAKKAGSRFMELKTSVVSRLKKLHEYLDKDATNVVNGNNPKDEIKRKSDIREETRKAEEEWNEMNTLYKNEAKKKRSKFTTEQLDTQQVLVTRLYNEIEKVKELHMNTYRPVQGRDEAALQLNTQALDGLESADFTSDTVSQWTSSPSTGGGVAMTDSQTQQLQIIQSKDEEFDMQLETIGEGLKDLSEIAQMQNEEVRRQNATLESVGNKIEQANEHITNVNQRMKDTLADVRGADKICVDILCIVMIIGLSAVLYKFLT